ncbi:PQQ-dependent sugar dehydrogenase [Azohydromonas australica]|uniref:PQQ-dependent sugar dehydrogenase n=1 Tax=Azohydromonas australica TaxID=364039 RepID=UPI00041B9100|nr:PQQ-dependent sugar dehydrogenase [Azohydromonas australica]
MRKDLHADAPGPLVNCSRREALHRLAGAGGAVGLAAMLPGCGGSDDGAAATESPQALAEVQAEALPAARTLHSGLDHAWGLAFLPDHSMLVTERIGRLRHVSADGSRISTVSGVPVGRIQNAGHGGLLDVAVDTQGSDIWVYLSYAEHGTGDQFNRAGTAVARARLVGNDLRDFHVIFRAYPKYLLSISKYHYGSRLLLAGSGKLFITLGEGRSDELRGQAQWLSSHLGKIVRINRDGSVPADNPFVGHEHALPEIWTLGHRNPQGLALHPATGELWSSEHGPQGGDELNLIERGHNYGWPRISHGCEYGTPVDTCTVVGGSTSAPGLDQPVTHWGRVRIAPSGMTFCDGRMFPEWRNHLVIAGLGGKELWRVVIEGRRVVSRTRMYAGLGERFRHVQQAPDGALLLLTDEANGRVLRIAR